jgi:hypothetical protein
MTNSTAWRMAASTFFFCGVGSASSFLRASGAMRIACGTSFWSIGSDFLGITARIVSAIFYENQALKIFVISRSKIKVNFFNMPKPKLPEEDRKEVMPLRLPREAIAAVHDLAEDWGNRKGKEVKPATVARELVLIGLEVIAALRQNKMLIDLLRGEHSQQVSKIRRMVNHSNSGMDPEDVARAIIKILRANPPIADRNPSIDDEYIPTEKIDPLTAMATKYGPTKKGGK